MPEKYLRIALVGAATLLGKALNDELAASAFASADFHLLDDEQASGRLAAAADEAALIQPIDEESFDDCDFTFFAGSRELTKKHWRQALKAGSRIVDLSGELEGSPGIPVRAPWVQAEAAASDVASIQQSHAAAPDLRTRAVVSAHPVAVLLALLRVRTQRLAALHGIFATLLHPASEFGHAGLEELHQQTTNLLSFQPLPTEVFGGQTAFTLAVSFGSDSRIALDATAEVIQRHYEEIARADGNPLALQVIQVPVFHGYALSVAVEFAEPVAVKTLTRTLAGPHLHIVSSAKEFPGNVQAVEEDEAQVLARPVMRPAGKSEARGTAEPTTTRFWLWIVADNLKLAAQNAVACAVELNRLRPRGKVQ